MSDLLDLRAVNATLHLGPCAEVRVGEHVIRYVRRGTGPCVVLLGANSDANALWGPLAESLSSGHRVVVPQLPHDEVDSSAWLRGFVEGLGLSSCVVIAGPKLASAALELLAMDDFTVRRLVLFEDSEHDRSADPRLLHMSPTWSAEEATAQVEHFLTTTE